MHDMPSSVDFNKHNLERTAARQNYFRLRDKLVSLESVSDPNCASIDSVVQELEQAQLAFKATYGMFGNNPIDDSAPQTQSIANGQPRTLRLD